MNAFVRGQRGFIDPGSPEHSRIITPSKVAAIIGESRWESPFRLWMRMKGLVPPEPPKDAFDIGHDYEPAAANRWRRRNTGWDISTAEVQFHVPAGHFPFPAMATIDRRASRGAWRRIVEFKMARDLSDLDRWGDDLSGDCPEDYQAQVIAQRLFVAAAQPSLKWLPQSHLFVLGPYANERQYDIDYDPSVAAWIIDECAAFYKSLSGDTPPDLDDQPATYECLKALHPDIEAGEDVAIDPALALDYLEAGAAEKDAKQYALGMKNQLLDAMKNAQYARVGDVTIADRRSNGKGGVALYSRPSALTKIQHLEGTSA